MTFDGESEFQIQNQQIRLLGGKITKTEFRDLFLYPFVSFSLFCQHVAMFGTSFAQVFDIKYLPGGRQDLLRGFYQVFTFI